ncbi:hypothetical protein BN1708_011562 [Verticillium longisporum]|uniref:Uncharacterized protein n=1 Tax=Verticillium longisporum TaxID=100787 RepID=A0A0G4L1H6_VERLO|nr:NLP effector protein 10 like [Verticillium longisporum]CRK15819.1 hypothetical protein BN1708_011562 [Verticillium longisporum]
MQHTLLSTAALLGALSAVNASPAPILRRDIITALPGSADEIENKFQPILDFDTDGCYNTAAIDPDGNINPGKGATGTPQGDCRDPPQLENSNVYSRRRCNNGVCAIMYEYYFEKDQSVSGSFAGGHRHDWENVVVFARGDTIVRVAPSCHGGYGGALNEFPVDGTSPQMVYHKDSAGTHCFRFANDADIGGVENFSGSFYKSPLVGWLSWPNEGLRQTMFGAFSGGVGPKLDDEFAGKLGEAAGDAVPEFDPNVDE